MAAGCGLLLVSRWVDLRWGRSDAAAGGLREVAIASTVASVARGESAIARGCRELAAANDPQECSDSASQRSDDAAAQYESLEPPPPEEPPPPGERGGGERHHERGENAGDEAASHTHRKAASQRAGRVVR